MLKQAMADILILQIYRSPFHLLRRATRVNGLKVGGILLALTLGSHSGGAQILHSFAGGADGANPAGGLALGPNGMLYGTTTKGGVSADCTDPQGCGTVYQLTPPSTPGGSWSESVIYAYPSFTNPVSAPTVGPTGELYVTGYFGGQFESGDVSELTPPTTPGEQWTRTELYTFSYPSGDPQNPAGSVVIGPHGVLYGTIQFAGTSANCFAVLGTLYGCGGVYSLTPPATPGGAWTEQTLYIFQGSPGDGAVPITALATGENGVLYGATNVGGSGTNCLTNTVLVLGSSESFTFSPQASNCGTIFELDPPSSPGGDWTETVLYNFQGQRDGGFPNTVTYRNGKLYGTVTFGGDPKNCGGAGCGGVFELSPPHEPGGEWSEQVIYSFTSGSDGLFPGAGVTFGPGGALYGTTRDGGNSSPCPGNPGCGIVYQLKPPTFPGLPWQESVVHRFAGTDGSLPVAGLTTGADGALYGATLFGGNSATCVGGFISCGTAFRVDPQAWAQPWQQEKRSGPVPDAGGNIVSRSASGRMK